MDDATVAGLALFEAAGEAGVPLSLDDATAVGAVLAEAGWTLEFKGTGE